ncbi:hypothetical protein RN001_006170 [Aquatica leii]|uniref:Uncharacterized protein n=1 Tax=Aquatica leii TaxID=1421715 RepID=A0AAN7PI52_9COLE|nr:hypothetical protein RN001_006170 [Aquatica leii]
MPFQTFFYLIADVASSVSTENSARFDTNEPIANTLKSINILSTAKKYYLCNLDGYGDEKVISMWNKALQQCTSEVWEKCVIHTEKLIQEWYNREKFLDITEEPLIINVGLNDSSSSESSDSDV